MNKVTIALGAGFVVTLAFLAKTTQHANAVDSVLRETQQMLSVSQREVEDLKEKLGPYEQKRAAATRIRKEFDLAANGIESITFLPAITPGTLSGSWRASGDSWGGQDDTISGFRIADPTDALLESSQRSSSGKFLVKINSPGTYRLVFENAGILRQTPRRIFLQGEFHPD